MGDSLQVKLNLLNLDMQKYLQLTSTSFIVGFSYFVGVFIVYITDQLNLKNPNVYRLLAIITVFVLGYSSLLFFKGLRKIKRISKAILSIMQEQV